MFSFWRERSELWKNLIFWGHIRILHTELLRHWIYRYFDKGIKKQTEKDTIYSGYNIPFIHVYGQDIAMSSKLFTRLSNYNNSKYRFTLRRRNWSIVNIQLFPCTSFWRRKHASTDKTEKREAMCPSFRVNYVEQRTKASPFHCWCF